MVAEEIRVESFDGFARRIEPRLREVLSASLGTEAGREAAAEALAYAWEHWDKVRELDRPAAYLYVLARNRARRAWRRRRIVLMPVSHQATPWVEPGLPGALAGLPEQQRTVVMLLYCFDWTMSEVADLLEISKSTVQTHAERGMARLRSRLGVTA